MCGCFGFKSIYWYVRCMVYVELLMCFISLSGFSAVLHLIVSCFFFILGVGV